MTGGSQIAIEALLGYISPPLVSVITSRRWPAEAKLAIALILSAIAAGVVVGSEEGAVGLAGFTASFGRIFTVQQITWGLRIPGAGSTSVNDKASEVGRKATGEEN